MIEPFSRKARSARETQLLEQALAILPAGARSPTPSPEYAMVVKEASGSRIRDLSGNEYIDYLMGSGPLLLGHAHPEVEAAVKEAVCGGSSYLMLNENAVKLAQKIVEAVPSAEQVCFNSTGSESTFFAMRLARAYRKRDKILKFEGGFHGMNDYALMSNQWTQQTVSYPGAVPNSAGIPASVQQEVLVAPFNDLDRTADIISRHADELAGVILEPLQRTIVPQPGFLEGLRDSFARAGIAAQVCGEAPAFQVWFSEEPIVDFRSLQRADHRMNNRFTELLLDRGVLKAHEKFFVSLAHTDEDLDRTLAAFDSAIDELQTGGW